MNFASAWILCLLAGSGAANAADLDVGFGAAVATDLPDKISKDYARFGPGPSLQIPIRYALAPSARLRASLRADLGTGSDRVTWGESIDGEEQRFFDDDHFAMFLATALTLGPEIVLPLDGPLEPYFGVEAGAAWVGTYHSLGGITQRFMDPAVNDLKDPGNIDPFTSQVAFVSDIHVGALTSGDVGAWFELGYSMAFVGESELTKTLPNYNARRSAYGWNAARLGAGVNFRI